MHVFLFSCARTPAPIVLSAFLFSLATGDVRPQHTPLSFLHFSHRFQREVNLVHVTYVFRFFPSAAAMSSFLPSPAHHAATDFLLYRSCHETGAA